ncbi:MAG: type II toxin-antitoxin system VapC family toxin [Alphaproteobacteria bacterium]|nr:type II toxin-antitoxin system VapC family toxin [Alphaproteobacteria bacterium]MCW5739011.1 type II toxin-antitoxin system VapC family toxin [Alphaproteobacteria bacterium]
MTAVIDTNVIVRVLVQDDPTQAATSRALIESEAVRVLSTVLLETVWTLERAYGLQRPAIVAALTGFMGLPTVRVDDPAAVWRALELYAGGLDFADALHLCLAMDADRLVTFDRAFARDAAKLRRSEPVVDLL